MRTPYYVFKQTSYPNGMESSWRKQEGLKQKPFEPVPLPYKCLIAQQKTHEPIGWYADGSYQSGATSSFFFPAFPLDRPEMTVAVNKARSKFLSAVGGSSELGTTLVEWRSSLEMITARTQALAKGYKHLRRGQLKAFFETFNIRPKARHRRMTWSKPKDASALWIEYWFGWAPTVSDVYDSIEVLQNPVNSKHVEAASGREVNVSDDWSTDNTVHTLDSKGFCIAKFGGTVSVENSNLYQASQLGLVNPALIAWNVAPFSWFVDWFVNVDEFLGGFSDTLGLEFKDLYLTRFGRLESHVVYMGNISNPSYIYGKVEDAWMVQMERELLSTLPMPRLTATLPLGLSKTRAATAVSLLILLFTSEKKI